MAVRIWLFALAFASLALGSLAQAATVLSYTLAPTVGVPGFSTYTFTATSDAGSIIGFNFAGQADSTFGVFGDFHQVSPFGQPSVFGSALPASLAAEGFDAAIDSHFLVNAGDGLVIHGQESPGALHAAFNFFDAAQASASLPLAQLVVRNNTEITFRGEFTVATPTGLILERVGLPDPPPLPPVEPPPIAPPPLPELPIIPPPVKEPWVPPFPPEEPEPPAGEGPIDSVDPPPTSGIIEPPLIITIPEFPTDLAGLLTWRFPMWLEWLETMPTRFDGRLINFEMIDADVLDGRLAIQPFAEEGTLGATVYFTSADAAAFGGAGELEAAVLRSLASAESLVPEPASGALAALAFLSVVGRARRSHSRELMWPRLSETRSPNLGETR